ncbi:hypothetical protein H8D36_05495 [archaeon]|nr:hypothetical protein [archaeon]MBL7057294.1 hypothetical protein [Candidatus Woesearchaeota archaeon]
MSLPKILGTKDPKDFVNMQVRIFQGDGEVYFANVEGAPMGFQEMMKLRSEECDPEVVKKQLQGEGYLFANLGLSVALTTTIKNKNYAVLVMQEREDLGDTVAKPVSGYVDSRHLHNPLLTVDEEIAEEVILTTLNGRIIPGLRNTQPLPRPFENIEGVEYLEDAAYQLTESSLEIIDGLVGHRTGHGLVINGNSIFNSSTATQRRFSPQLYFQIPSNSAQMMFRYHIDVPNIGAATLDHAEKSFLRVEDVSMNHSEDKYNPVKRTLNIERHDNGLLLIQLNGERLTDKVYTFENGKLVPYSTQVILSEAFAPKDNGIVTAQNITLDQYLLE